LREPVGYKKRRSRQGGKKRETDRRKAPCEENVENRIFARKKSVEKGKGGRRKKRGGNGAHLRVFPPPPPPGKKSP